MILILHIELLQKQMSKRMSLQDALDHPWFISNNYAISKIRKTAIKEGNDLLKFISYSNVHTNIF